MASGRDTERVGEDAETVAARLRRQLETAQQITHIGSWEWDLATGVVTWSDELYRIYGYPPRAHPVTFESFVNRVHPDDRDKVQREIGDAIKRGGRFAHRERIIRADGSIRQLDSAGEVTVDDAGRPARLVGTCRDVTEEERHQTAVRRANRLQAEERRALEMLAAGAPLPDILAVIVRMIEELSPEATASILMLDPTGTRLRHGAAPGLPDAYNRAIIDAPIGPRAGSCGTAAFRREPVYSLDIATDPLWADYPELRAMLAAVGLRACWSTPILATDGRVLGTFAVYYRDAREPDASSRELIERATHVAGIAIERRQLDELLHALSERIEAIREDERTGIAREIHDVLGQALTTLKLDIAWVARRSEAGPVADKLADMSRTTDQIIAAVRRISAELRPGILDQLGLLAAIEWQAEEFANRTGIRCEVKSDLGDLRLARDLATAVFRIFQEALTNVARHAQATLVEVELRMVRGRLELEVRDDGTGVPETVSPAASGSLGLLGMRERARRLGGDCVVKRRSPRGTIVAVSIPLRFPADQVPPADETGPFQPIDPTGLT